MLKFRKISWEDSSQNLKTLFCFLKPQKKILPQKAESILQLYFKLHALTFRETWKTWFGPILGLFIQRRFVQKTPEQDIFPKKGFFVYITWSKYKYKNKTSLIFLFHTPRDRFSTRTTKKIASLLNHILLKSQFVIYKIT